MPVRIRQHRQNRGCSCCDECCCCHHISRRQPWISNLCVRLASFWSNTINSILPCHQCRHCVACLTPCRCCCCSHIGSGQASDDELMFDIRSRAELQGLVASTSRLMRGTMADQSHQANEILRPIESDRGDATTSPATPTSRGLDVRTLEQVTSTITFRDLPPQNLTDGDRNRLQQCSVCLEQFSDGQVLRLLPCMHGFHQYCIDRWLQQHRSCPLCLHVVTPFETSESHL